MMKFANQQRLQLLDGSPLGRIHAGLLQKTAQIQILRLKA